MAGGQRDDVGLPACSAKLVGDPLEIGICPVFVLALRIGVQGCPQQAIQQDVAGLTVVRSGIPDALFKLNVAIETQLRCSGCGHADKV